MPSWSLLVNPDHAPCSSPISTMYVVSSQCLGRVPSNIYLPIYCRWSVCHVISSSLLTSMWRRIHLQNPGTLLDLERLTHLDTQNSQVPVLSWHTWFRPLDHTEQLVPFVNTSTPSISTPRKSSWKKGFTLCFSSVFFCKNKLVTHVSSFFITSRTKEQVARI